MSVCGQRWSFTLNNYTEEEIELINSFLKKCIYGIYGKEVGEQGTPHLQGYFKLQNRRRLGGLKKEKCFIRAHLEPSRKCDQANVNYCKKENDFTEFGQSQEIQNTLEKTAYEIACVRAEGEDETQIYNYDSALVKYYRNIQCVTNDKLSIKNRAILLANYDHVTWRSWQSDLISATHLSPCARRIYYYWDTEGNTGKTYLSIFLVLKHGALRANANKAADVAHAYMGQKIVVFDMPRGAEIDWQLIEDIKNGAIFSGKYNSQHKLFQTPHVFIFSNEYPQYCPLSKDRLIVRQINGSTYSSQEVSLDR